MKPGVQRAGFTLLEIVVALLLMAVLSTAFIPMVRMSQQRSAQTLMSTVQSYELQNQMELLVAAYKEEIDGGGTAAAFQPKVPGLLAAGVVLEQNDFVTVSGGMLVADSVNQELLRISIRDASGYRLRRLFSAN